MPQTLNLGIESFVTEKGPIHSGQDNVKMRRYYNWAITTKSVKSFMFWILFLLLLSCSFPKHVPHMREELVFHSGRFTLAGELRAPEVEGKSPVIIFVHGDGPNDRTSYGTYLPIMSRFLRAGYACFSWDKPGTGKSTGEIDRDRLRYERAEILVDAIEMLKKHPSIDSARIGLWGISQAGYVMPQAFTMTDAISFMIAVSCPGMSGINQTAYLIRKQLLCEGSSENEARQAEKHFAGLFTARTYQEYLQHAQPLVENPIVQKMKFVTDIRPEEEWKPHDLEGEGFFNPMEIIEITTIPVLAFFGEKDTQVDPLQGVEAYKKALEKAGNQNFRIELIPNTDHNIIQCKTGCLSERDRRSSGGWKNYAPEYLDIMEEWLRQLSKAVEDA